MIEMKSNGDIICLCAFSVTSLSLNTTHIKDIDISFKAYRCPTMTDLSSNSNAVQSLAELVPLSK